MKERINMKIGENDLKKSKSDMHHGINLFDIWTWYQRCIEIHLEKQHFQKLNFFFICEQRIYYENEAASYFFFFF